MNALMLFTKDFATRHMGLLDILNDELLRQLPIGCCAVNPYSICYINVCDSLTISADLYRRNGDCQHITFLINPDTNTLFTHSEPSIHDVSHAWMSGVLSSDDPDPHISGSKRTRSSRGLPRPYGGAAYGIK